jgi:uncharacterized protein YggE
MKRSVLALSVALVCLALAPASDAAALAVREGKIRILGRATIEVAPDYALVRAGISTKAATPTAAMDQNSAIARKMIDFSKRFGIDEQDLRTDAISLAPAFKNVRDANGGTRSEPDGYRAENTLRVKLNDLARVGTYMRQILEQGATNIGGVQFGLSDSEKINDEARVRAVENARRQAQLLADAAKVKLGQIQEIVHPLRIQIQYAEGAAADLPVRPRRMAVPLEAGTVTVTAEVEITWAIE